LEHERQQRHKKAVKTYKYFILSLKSIIPFWSIILDKVLKM